ncbi:MAG: hypothetical protein KIT22_00105 [Verrucomicrobiae bacterium]|nr:hypothetical protein [Verrucomicrobiae bacterium]
MCSSRISKRGPHAVNWFGAEIPDGSANPATGNGTRIGGKGLNDGAREQIYTIVNLGQTPSNPTNNPPVVIGGRTRTISW